MLSFQSQYELAQFLLSDENTTNLGKIKELIRIGQRRLEAILGITFTEEIRNFTTVTDAIASTSDQAYKLPENFKSLTALFVTISSIQYPATLIQDESLWRQLNQHNSSESNFVQYCFIRNDGTRRRIELFPIPSSANTATLIYDAFSKPLVTDDYIDGNISALANGDTAVTGSSTTFTSGMEGRFLRIDDDGEWYKILTFGSTTLLTLDTEYQGVTISSGSEAYTIGQMPITPGDTHELPVYFAIWRVALMKKDVQLAREYERLWKEGVREAEQNWGNWGSSNVTPSHRLLRSRGPINTNLWPENLS